MHVEYLEFTHIVIFPGNSPPPLSVLSMSASNDWGLVHVLRSAQPIRAQDCVTPANGRRAADNSTLRSSLVAKNRFVHRGLELETS